MWRIVWRVYLIISIVTFALYGIDKFLAKAEWKRIPERWFHTLALIGGFPGAWFGMQVFKHKTNHPKFRWVIFAGLLIHVGILAITIARLRWF
ncbi:MAG: hypothetical protein CMI18_07765 [Opitutaceae bacterium]|nr:hypothetical protein [Opitutaceae bacterium]|tara:strand:+ start:18587 stop:18865 length:279 start_codon:yes stop_codon:yes gene_type:complete